MTWRIALAGVHHLMLASAYAPTIDSVEATKDAFYNRIDEILRRIPNNDKILLMGYSIARVGSNHIAWNGVLGWNGVDNCDANGHRLLTLCAEHQLIIKHKIPTGRDLQNNLDAPTIKNVAPTGSYNGEAEGFF